MEGTTVGDVHMCTFTHDDTSIRAVLIGDLKLCIAVNDSAGNFVSQQESRMLAWQNALGLSGAASLLASSHPTPPSGSDSILNEHILV